MSATLTSPRHDATYAWAATAAALAGFGGLVGLAFLQAGTPCWLQGTIYLLAAWPLARGLTGLLQWRWYGRHEGYRRGVLLVAAALGLAWHGWRSVRAHQERVARDEQAFAPLIEALTVYHRDYGVYPPTLAELSGPPTTAPDGVKGRYLALGGQSYVLSFVHNVVVSHRYDPVTGRWTDVF